jgi:hypothetical protein
VFFALAPVVMSMLCVESAIGEPLLSGRYQFVTLGYDHEPQMNPLDPKPLTWEIAFDEGSDDLPVGVTAFRVAGQSFKVFVGGTSFDSVSTEDFAIVRYDASRP